MKTLARLGRRGEGKASEIKRVSQIAFRCFNSVWRMIVSRITPGNTFIYDKKEVASKALHQDLPHPSATSNQWAGCLETEPPSQSHAGTGSAAPAPAASAKASPPLVQNNDHLLCLLAPRKAWRPRPWTF